jgi:hypothetical protein
MRYDNTLVERPSGTGGIVTGACNAAASPPFTGPAADIFAGPLPAAPVSAPPGAYQLKPGGIWIDSGNNSLYGASVSDLSGISPPGATQSSAPPAGPGPAEDFAGNARPRGLAVDLGAYEKQ